MADTLVGVDTVREIQILVDGNPYLSATVTYTLTDPTGTVVLNAVAAPHGGNGWYQAAVAAGLILTPGFYRESFNGTASTKTIQRQGGFLATFPYAPLVTRLELRQNIAQELRDLWTGTFDSVSAAGVVDGNRIESTNSFRNAHLYVTSGGGRWQERSLTASTSLGALTIQKGWTVTPATGDGYEIHKKWTVDEYNRAINLAIMTAAPRNLLTITDESLVITDGTVNDYVVPAGFTHLAQVWQLDAGAPEWFELIHAVDWKGLRPLRTNTPLRYYEPTVNSTPSVDRFFRTIGYWRVIPGRRVVTLSAPTVGSRMRLVGHIIPEPLQRDGAYVDLRPDYLILKACAHLLEQRIGGPQVDPDATAQRVNLYHTQAEAIKPSYRPLPGSVRLT